MSTMAGIGRPPGGKVSPSPACSYNERSLIRKNRAPGRRAAARPAGSSFFHPSGKADIIVTRRKATSPPEVKNRILEYFLLGFLFVVVVVTAWTLFDNGLVDTVAGFIGVPPP